jgi:GNAT superfamily N-acetyltransferase
MTGTLRPLTRDNLWAVVELKRLPGQEAFVADNIDSIANASVEPTWVPLAVYAGEALVGFVMYGQYPPDTGAWWVIRLMIDRAQQGNGYGRAAMEAVITDNGGPGRLRGDRDQLQPSERGRPRPLHLARLSAYRRDRGRRAAASSATR